MARGHVVMGLLFYPRGGSAYVVRYLTPALQRAGWTAGLAVGSLGEAGLGTNAATFFAGLDVHPLDYTDAARAFAAGGDAIAAAVPMHPSYEERADVPDVVFASVPPTLAEHLATAWDAPLEAAGGDRAALFHLHHLTPQLDAVQRRWPATATVVHLHGTEMKFIEQVRELAAIAAKLGETLETMPAALARLEARGELDRRLEPAEAATARATRWAAWPHGRFWADHLARQVHAADHVITVSPQNREQAVTLLGLRPEDVTNVPNGVDIEQFRPGPRTAGSRRAVFRRALVTDPRGWSPAGAAGSVAYREADLDRLLGPNDSGTVLLFVGRFLRFKRVPELVRAFARARGRFNRSASLVIWGGHPGEWEGQHPVEVAEEVGPDGIFFAGWRGHDDLPDGLAASDVLVVPSVEDPYPQVPLEAMAAGLPVLACASGGLLSMVNVHPDRPTGWLVPPDDPDALTEAIVGVVNDPAEVASRATNALAHARAELSWDGLVGRFEAVYEQALARRARRGCTVPEG
jgi:glycosyltransferase involved in cell wall biosynthesis